MLSVYLKKLIESNGLYHLNFGQFFMISIGFILLYLAIKKEYEPLLLVPIGFATILTNIPQSGLFHPEIWSNKNYVPELLKKGGLFDFLYTGVKSGIFPPLIFMGIGAMTDFSPLLANPITFLLGAAAQLGIFVTLLGTLLLNKIYPALNYTIKEAASIGIIGGADGPTAIFLTSKLAPHLLGPIAVAAYSYMSLVPIIQPPIMKMLIPEKERTIQPPPLREVSKLEKILFPLAVTLIASLLIPDATTLIGMLMFGNLLKEAGVVERLNNTAKNELINIVTILLGLSVGATMKAETFLNLKTIGILFLGVIAFTFATASGLILGRILCFLSGGKINPLIGAAGVSAVPMAARVVQKVAIKENPENFLLMHAMGPNVAGVIGSATAAGVLLSILK